MSDLPRSELAAWQNFKCFKQLEEVIPFHAIYMLFVCQKVHKLSFFISDTNCRHPCIVIRIQAAALPACGFGLGILTTLRNRNGKLC